MHLYKKFIKSFSYAIISLIFSFFIASQVFAAFQFGNYSMASHAGRTSLRTAFAGSAGLNSFSFLGRVGGVNFESTAFLSSQLKDDSVTLDYTSENEDGKRLKIFIGNHFLSFLRYFGSFGESIYKITGNKIANPSIYDWQLKPIAEYANSEYSGVVSLFGEGEHRNKYFYIEYHPAFEDTLLGLRLFQSDIMLINLDELAALPKQEGNLILGKGEVEPNVESSKKAIKEVKSILAKIDIQSWVLTDVKHATTEPQEGEILISNDQDIKIDVNPYYYFWKTNKDDVFKAEFISFLLNTIEDEIKEAILSNDSNKVQNLNEEKKKLEEEKNNIKITVVDEAIKQLKNSNLLYEINPAVFDAVKKTSQYAALFRLVRRDNSANWEDFIKKMDTVEISKIDTPSIWEKTRN